MMYPPLPQTVANPKATLVHPLFSQTTPKPTYGANDTVTVREDIPWPGTGKMSGNLFEERNWVLAKDYLAIEGKKEDATVAKPPPKEEHKMGEQTSNQKEENVVGDPIALSVRPKRKMLILPTYKNRWMSNSRSLYPNHKSEGLRH